MSIIGEYDADGQTKVEADICALTGRPVLGQHSVLARVPGTNFYYRYLSDFDHLLTPAKRAEIEALAGVVRVEETQGFPSSDAFNFKRKAKDTTAE